MNNKVISIYKEGCKVNIKNYNIGLILNYPIKEFIKRFNKNINNINLSNKKYLENININKYLTMKKNIITNGDL